VAAAFSERSEQSHYTFEVSVCRYSAVCTRSDHKQLVPARHTWHFNSVSFGIERETLGVAFVIHGTWPLISYCELL
jgi:hypothetical protein